MSRQEEPPLIFNLRPGLHDLRFSGAEDGQVEEVLGAARDEAALSVKILGAEPELPIEGRDQHWVIHVDGSYLAVESLTQQIQLRLGRQVTIVDVVLKDEIFRAFTKMNRP